MILVFRSLRGFATEIHGVTGEARCKSSAILIHPLEARQVSPLGTKACPLFFEFLAVIEAEHLKYLLHNFINFGLRIRLGERAFEIESDGMKPVEFETSVMAQWWMCFNDDTSMNHDYTYLHRRCAVEGSELLMADPRAASWSVITL